ncbi:hypothetical protein D9M71_643510 [compost metagenome]
MPTAASGNGVAQMSIDQGVVDEHFGCRESVVVAAVPGQYPLCAFTWQGALAGLAPIRQPFGPVRPL